MASQRSSPGTSCTRMRAQPALSSARRLAYRSCPKACGAVAGIDPGDCLVGLQRQALRQHGDALPAFGKGLGQRIESRRPARWSAACWARSAPPGCPARAARHLSAPISTSPTAGAQLTQRDGPGRSRRTSPSETADDGGFQAHLAFTAIEHHFDRIAEFILHMFGARGRQAADSDWPRARRCRRRRHPAAGAPWDARECGWPRCPGRR